jgi:hypothetical protein
MLTFITGLDVVPPLGFEPQPSLTLGHPLMDESDQRRTFPIANTCTNAVHLPLLRTYEEFKCNMNLALEMATTFSLV